MAKLSQILHINDSYLPIIIDSETQYILTPEHLTSKGNVVLIFTNSPGVDVIISNDTVGLEPGYSVTVVKGITSGAITIVGDPNTTINGSTELTVDNTARTIVLESIDGINSSWRIFGTEV